MGNSNSVEIDPALLNRLHYQSEEIVANEIISRLKIDNETKLTEFVTLIFNAAEANKDGAWMAVKYAKLVKLLSGIKVNDPKKGQLTFKDFLTKLISTKLEFYRFRLSPDEVFNTFLGELFNNGVYSATMICFWLNLLDNIMPAAKMQVLTAIRAKIESEFKKSEHEVAIDQIRDMMIEFRVIKPPLVNPPSLLHRPFQVPVDRCEESFAQHSSIARIEPPKVRAAAPVYESSSDSDDFQHNPSGYSNDIYQPNPLGYDYEEEDYSSYDEEASHYDYNYDNQSESSYAQSQSAPTSFPELFQVFLAGLETNPKLTFRFRRFKTCSEVDRKECAEVLLDAIITRPKIVHPAVFAVKTIQVNPPNNQCHPKFMDHLHDLIESKVSHLLKQTSKWTPMKNIGIFLAYLNNQNCITNATLNIWLDGVQVFVSKNNNSASRILLEVLKVSLNHMKTKDVAKFNFYVVELERIYTTVGYLPPTLAKWMDEVITNNTKAVQAPTTLPALFQTFLLGLAQNPSQPFDSTRFKTCSEYDRKKCAQLVLDTVIADPRIIEPLSCFMHTIQSSMTPNNVNHLKLSDHFSALVECKIDQLVQQESKWNPLENIGNFLAHLYNFECIKNATMNKWFDGLQAFVDNTNVRGTNVYVSVLKLTAEKLKIKNKPKFKFHVLQLQNLQPKVWLSPELQEWKMDFLRMYSTPACSIAPTTQNAINMQPQPTGAIRKTAIVQAAVVPQAPPAIPATITMVLQELNKMYGDHDALHILDEIVALRIEMSDTNLRKITNMMASKIVGKPNIIKSSVDILASLPHRSVPPFDPQELKNPLKLSLLDQIRYLQREVKPNQSHLDTILMFLTLLHSRKLVDTETIIDMAESLAVTARSDEKFPLTVLIKFLETDSACLMTKTDQLKETKATLQKHRSCSSAPEVKKSVEEALKMITPKTATAKPQPEVLDGRPSTSSACALTNNKTLFFKLLLELPSKNINDIKTIVDQIKSPKHCEEFAAALYEAAIGTEYFSLYAEIGQQVDQQLEFAGLSGTCSRYSAEFLYALSMGQQQTKVRKMIENRVKFIGELYKIKWIDIEGLTATMDKLSETEEDVQLFQTLLNIVALSVAQNGGGDKLIKYRDLYAKRQADYMDSTINYLACREVVRTLSNIAKMSVKRVLFDAEVIGKMIDGLNADNIEEQTDKIKSMSEGTEPEFQVIVSAILNKLAESDDDHLMAGFSCKLFEVFKESKAQLSGTFVDKCQELLIAKFLQSEETKSHNAFTLIAFFGKLYTTNVLNSDFIALCCEILVEGVDENKNICLVMLMSAIGSKLAAEDQRAATKIFEKFGDIIQEHETESYLAQNMHKLIELRENGWQDAGTSNSNQQSIALLENLTRSNLTSVSTCQEIVRMCQCSPKDLVTSFYFSVLRNPDKIDLYADLSAIIQKYSPAFKDYLKEYLQSHIVTVTDLKQQDFDEDTRSDLAATTIFIGELFVRGLIDEDSLAVLLKPAKHLRFDSINQLASVIGEKVSGGDNVRLKARLINLEDIAHDKAKQFWEVLRTDLGEVTKVVSRGEKHRSEALIDLS